MAIFGTPRLVLLSLSETPVKKTSHRQALKVPRQCLRSVSYAYGSYNRYNTDLIGLRACSRHGPDQPRRVPDELPTDLPEKKSSYK